MPDAKKMFWIAVVALVAVGVASHIGITRKLVLNAA